MYIDIQNGIDKEGKKEKSIRLYFGYTYTVVGNTGSGKSQLIEDIASLSDGDSITKRVITTSAPINFDTAIAHLSQNMTFNADYTVEEFFKMRFKCQHKKEETYLDVIQIANTLTGDQIKSTDYLVKLSGGQTRALMIADIILNEEASIILMDEIENAGIDKLKAIEMLKAQNKLVILITHHPSLALIGDYRLLMNNGGISDCISRNEEEKKILLHLAALDKNMQALTQCIREGVRLNENLLEQYMPYFTL